MLRQALVNRWKSLVTKRPPAQVIQEAFVDRRRFDLALLKLKAIPASQWAHLPDGTSLVAWLWETDQLPHLTSPQKMQATLVMLDQGATVRPAEGEALMSTMLTQYCKSRRVVQALLALGVPATMHMDSNPASHTAVCVALRKAYPLIALDLIAHGADPLQVDAEGHTLLHALALGAKVETTVRGRRTQSRRGRSGGRVEPEEEHQQGRDHDGAFQAVLLCLVEAGVDLNALNHAGHSAYAMADDRLRHMMKELPGLKLTGLTREGHSLAYEAVVAGHLEEVALLMVQDPTSFMLPDANGALPAWGWWEIDNPGRSAQTLEWLKSQGLWESAVHPVATSLPSTTPTRRGFLMYGLQRLCSSPNPDKLVRLEWQLARLESEIPTHAWVDMDASGETLNFWLTSTGRQDLVEKYVLPRRQAMLNAVLAHTGLKAAPAKVRF